MSQAELRLVGWGSSLLNKASDSSPFNTVPAAQGARDLAEPSGHDQIEEKLQRRIAQLMTVNNRRRQKRLTRSAEIHVQDNSGQNADRICGEVLNFSSGGLCMLSPVALPGSSLVQCRIGVPEVDFAIPTLMQVVWVEEMPGRQFEIGLRYLF
jgi:hypothetical protein